MKFEIRRVAPLVLSISAGCLTGTLLLTNADVTRNDGHLASRFGYAARGIGDFDGNGAGDFVVSAPNPGHDKVYIYQGPPSALDGTWPAPKVFQGENNGEAGWAVASGALTPAVGLSAVGAIAIAAPSELAGRGRIYILRGPKPSGNTVWGPADAYAILEGSATAEYAGWSLAVGDVVGDSNADLIIGACGDRNFQGKVYVVRGPIAAGTHSLAAYSYAQILGQNLHGQFGCAVATTDLNDDGRDELVVGANQETTGEGHVYVYWSVPAGIRNSTAIADSFRLSGPIDNGVKVVMNLGDALAGGGDLNGDGVEDLAMAAPDRYCHLYAEYPLEAQGYGCSGNTPTGHVFVLFGVAQTGSTRPFIGAHDAEVLSDVVIRHSGSYLDEFGYALSIRGDLNGDGEDELLIGSRAAHRAWLFYGGANAEPFYTSAQAHAVFERNGSFAGMAVDLAPDLNGDGRAEVLIGAPGQEWFGHNQGQVMGAAHIYYGEP